MARQTEVLIHPSKGAGPYAIYGITNFGYRSYNAASLPDRVFAGLDEASRPPSVINEAALDVRRLPTPLATLLSPRAPEGQGWAQATRRAVARLEALWLLVEDRYRLLDADTVEPLAHQASLVEHVLADPNLRRVLVADEVGLGKTIEAGLIIRRLIEARSGASPRALYLTEAALVDNVVEELERLGLEPRRWTAERPDARLEPGRCDPLVVASMQRAVFQVQGGKNHFETVATSGPWDVLVIDEAHHLSDWSSDGKDPQQRMRLVRRLVEERLAPEGRLLLLSGTPHQGHAGKFKNLLHLLRAEREGEEVLKGRVIYRIKEDIRDWDGQPLFPVRDVRPPTRIDCGEAYRDWLRQVHALLSLAGDSRAAGWRRAQALQWCASSPQAGLAYLTRLALRAGLRSATDPALRGAIAALRPYRGRPADESVSELEAYLCRQMPEIGEGGTEEFRLESALLGRVLGAGIELIASDVLARKLAPVLQALEEAPDEKFVLFAQPIETVYTLHARLEALLGAGQVALIVGGQDPAVRRAAITRFQRADGARVLVSSRSGGEGINLQIARRLVHFDIPWNPMEMEQRVGRVHRFGSVQTVIVETLVVRDSREERILARCRARLGQIVRDMDHDRLELHYSRTMALIPLEELAALMSGEGFGPLSRAEEDRLDRLIQEGYERWKQTDAEFRMRAAALRTIERGAVNEVDLQSFIEHTLGAKVEPGWKRRSLAEVAGQAEPVLQTTEARVYRLPDGSLGYVGRDAGLGLSGPQAEPVRRLGLNDRSLAAVVRELVGAFDEGEGEGEGEGDKDAGDRSSQAPWDGDGAGLVLAEPAGYRALCETAGLGALREGFLLQVYCLRRLVPQMVPPREVGTALRAFAGSADGEVEVELDAEQLAILVRMIRQPRPKRARPEAFDRARLLAVEEQRIQGMRVSERGGPVVAVFPVAAIWVEPASASVGTTPEV